MPNERFIFRVGWTLFLLYVSSCCCLSNTTHNFNLGSKKDNRTSEDASLSNFTSVSNVRLLISSDSPTTMGAPTTIQLRSVGHENGSLFVFVCWSNDTPEQRAKLASVDTAQFTIRAWKSVGLKQIFGAVTVKSSRSGNDPTVAKNFTSVTVTSSLNMHMLISQRGDNFSTNTNHIAVGLGNAVARVHLHDPSRYFGAADLTYTWQLSTNNGTVIDYGEQFVHDFSSRDNGTLSVKVNAAYKGNIYSGESSSNLTVNVIWVHGFLSVWGNNPGGRHLPSRENTLATGPIHFQVNITRHHPMFVSAITVCYWSFGDGDTSTTTTTATQHVYARPQKRQVSVDVAIFIDKKSYEAKITKSIILKDPVRDLRLVQPSSIFSKRTMEFIAICNGSAPVSFCWFVSYGKCGASSSKVVCSPMLTKDRCHLYIDHIFHRSGSYCLNVTVVNDVSSVSLQLDLKVHSADQHESHTIAALTLILLLVSVIIVVVWLLVKKRKRSKRRKQKKTEIAKFDFRDSVSFEQARFLNSTPDSDCKQPCMSWCLSCRRFSDEFPTQERAALFDTSPVEPTTPHRKISYYGAVHMGLLQQNNKGVLPDVPLAVAEEDEHQEVEDNAGTLSKSI